MNYNSVHNQLYYKMMAAHENNICIETSELDLEEASIAQEEADIYTPLLHEHQQSHKHTNDITHRIIIHRMTVVTVASIIISVLLLYAYVTSIPDGANNNNLFSYYLSVQISFYGIFAIINAFIFSNTNQKPPISKINIANLFKRSNIFFMSGIIVKIAYVTAVIVLSITGNQSNNSTVYFNYIILEFILFIIIVYTLFITNSYMGETPTPPPPI